MRQTLKLRKSLRSNEINYNIEQNQKKTEKQRKAQKIEKRKESQKCIRYRSNQISTSNLKNQEPKTKKQVEVLSVNNST